MRYLYTLLLLCSTLYSLSPTLFAEKKDIKIPVPETVSRHCLMNNSGSIDYCPEYRSQIRDINTALSQKRTDAEIKGQITLYDVLHADVVSFTNEQGQQERNSLEGTTLFLRDYKQYVTNLFVKFFNTHTNEGNLVASFFKTTYFDEDQSGL